MPRVASGLLFSFSLVFYFILPLATSNFKLISKYSIFIYVDQTRIDHHIEILSGI
jgi:hypothetical protein